MAHPALFGAWYMYEEASPDQVTGSISIPSRCERPCREAAVVETGIEWDARKIQVLFLPHFHARRSGYRRRIADECIQPASTATLSHSEIFDMILEDAEFERRKPVWTAFSTFWLDAELGDADLRYIARVAAASGYSVAKLRDIYLYEVAPVVSANLLTTAGEWAGLDEQWLHAEARKRAEHRGLWLRFRVFIRIGRGLMTYATEPYWRRMEGVLRRHGS
ncbi:MAG: hypothetical protein LBU11_08800 [Zoogloeaceae bacterium]|nr:hypothetical protein [Zoogloeaceae bacterium]